jgi:hypothetical protein
MVHATEEMSQCANITSRLVVTILFASAVKVFFLTPTAEANVLAVKGAGMDVSRMHENRALPVQVVHDMTFVYSDEN